MESIRLKIRGRSREYEIITGNRILDGLGRRLRQINPGERPFIITSMKIGRLYLNKLVAVLKEAGYKYPGVCLIPDGESQKNILVYEKIVSALAGFGGEEKGEVFVINLGGGVVGDIGGFVAATYKRGIKYIQVPTTLLAMADSGVGGKTGIDYKKAKNIIGAFHQPSLVYADIKLLDSLGERDFISGLAEIIKYGVIKDRNLFEYLERNIEKILRRDPACLELIVSRSYRIKADIVKKDELDITGIRMKLNFGHTIGHAVEALSGYSLKHGEAVAIGMCAADDIAVRLGILNKEAGFRIEKLIESAGLPVRIKLGRKKNIKEFLKQDKKNKEAANRFVFAQEIGSAVIRTDISEEIIGSVIRERIL